MNIEEMMREAQRVSGQIQQLQDQVGSEQVEGSAGGGMVVVTANGKGEILAVKIDPEVVSAAEVEMLQDLVVAATNQALARAQELMKSAITRITGGASIPGLF